MRAFLPLALLPPLAAAAPVPVPAPVQNTMADWVAPTAPFRIFGNVYYVGSKGLSAYLVTGAHGHILIDGGLPETAKQIADNIRTLGFKLEDVRLIFINHAHFDHAGGLAELKRLTGAELVASAGDKADLEAGKTAGRPDLLGFPPAKVDDVVEDGTRIGIGGLYMVAHLTPGHTRGCTSWSTDVNDGDRTLTVLFACSFTVAGQKLVGSADYPQAADDFRATFTRLKSMKADIFLNFHPAAFGMEEKRAKLAAGDRLAFVDPGELARRVAAAEAGFAKDLAAQQAAAR